MKPFRGTGVAVITPFDAHRKLDTSSLERIIDHLIDGGVEYLVALGTTGETATLKQEEKEQVVETFIRHNDGRLPLVLGVGGNDTHAVCKQLDHFQSTYDLDGILSVSPYYNKPTQEGIYFHYKEIAQTSDLPVILYNVPGRTSSNILPETVLRLAHDFENIVAVKEASGDLEQGMKIINGRPEGFSVISGDDALALPGIAMGFDGVISVIANAVPADFSEMVRSGLAGDMEHARKLHYTWMKMIGLIFREGNPAGVKLLMHELGLCQTQVRLPLVAGSSELLQDIKKELTTK